ncbi:Endonuclease, Uma2 family (restriction endonuclease fold) [Singulisphaera sp. GP187]|uniref:Uma2 family endonuclease n=1 Tax=Singulisphaera sp. GP187 TaxID=1882752 RepID=UPI000926AFF5|nr:Uma2 family endonuclease [Singulisphaera sp. GP187]SIO32228.1 Endonuclease, Uma2 family (restriction endonuclease fold) [Singulisphaera sp. GP187]
MATVTPQTPDVAPTLPVADDTLYEVVDGQVVEKATMGAYEAELASLLVGYLITFARTHKLGRVVCEALFLIDRGRNLQRRPDVAFVSDARWPYNRSAPRTAAWDVIPDLAIEVNSPTNTGNEIIAKVDEYFRAGVQYVWVVYPNARTVYLYESPNQVKILQVGDTLDGAPLLPGFHLPLAALFEEQAE